MRVRDTGGDGRPLLLVHSLLVDGDIWAPVVARLATGRRCIVPELPLGAHCLPLQADADLTPPGLAKLLVEILDALVVDRVDVVGVDTGGALTQLLMAHHRERIGRVVLCSCDAYEAFPPQSLRWWLTLVKWRAGVWLLAQAGRSSAPRRLASLRRFTHHGADTATVRRWTAPLRLSAGVRRDLRKVVRGARPHHTLAAAEVNQTFPNPVLAVWGDDDRVFPRSLAERLARDLPDARLVVLPDCSLFVPLDQPDRLAELIDAHLRAPATARARV